jgi:leader peptidase (prepilin peptidase)/N-methyltransferase
MILKELQNLPYPAILALSGLLGLVIGSFLNVVIHRLPIILFRNWRQECQEFLGQEKQQAGTSYNLATPGSHCPQCRHPIRWYHNLPMFSYIWLRGQCADCGQAIPWKYPAVEIITALMTIVVVHHFGLTSQGLFALLFTWGLIALSVIDIEHQILPDQLTQGLLWLGLFASLWPVFVNYEDAILGAMIGYAALWSVYQLFKLLTGKEGMGYGDFKLFAAAGAWMGWQYLPMIILLASLFGSIIGGILIASGRLQRNNPVSFGPYLALTSWVCLLWGDAILGTYLRWAGL